MQTAKSGDKVKVHYEGKLTNGETFDSSSGRAPLEFEVGSGMVIKGFDEGVTGMSVGEKKPSIFLLKKRMARKTLTW
jgi:peptidylprolyl isomerase